jgi:5'-methylthioadenosine phosphorylase
MIKAEIGVIGGAGYYTPNFLINKSEISINTPYGKPSSSIIVGEYSNKKIAFLPRHGTKYKIASPFVNYRSNIYAFHKLGVKKIIAPCAVGSLNPKIKLGSFVIPTQLIDFTKKRLDTFSDKANVIQTNPSKPFDIDVSTALRNSLKSLKLRSILATYVCIEGPRFATEAEKIFYNQIGADIIGMDLYPENVLAMELGIKYASFALVTDLALNDQREDLLKEIFEITTEKSNLVEELIKRTIQIL